MVEIRGRRLRLAGAALGVAGLLVAISPAGRDAAAATASAPAVVFLSGVSALSSSNAWAVGTWSRTGGSPWRSLIEHYTGGRWAIKASPNPGNDSNSLNAVTALSNHQRLGGWHIPHQRQIAEDADRALEWQRLEGPGQPEPGDRQQHALLGGGDLAVERVGRRQHTQHLWCAEDAHRALERQVMDGAAQS
jgi:hypothetical protein